MNLHDVPVRQVRRAVPPDPWGTDWLGRNEGRTTTRFDYVNMPTMDYRAAVEGTFPDTPVITRGTVEYRNVEGATALIRDLYRSSGNVHPREGDLTSRNALVVTRREWNLLRDSYFSTMRAPENRRGDSIFGVRLVVSD